MKRMKKIVGVILSLMMVFGMGNAVGADETGASGTAATGNGKITIDNAVAGQTYKIYRILDLESHSGSGENANYAYKLRGNGNAWDNFIKGSNVSGKYVTIDGEYVSWVKDASAEGFVGLAKEYIADPTNNVSADGEKKADGNATTEGRTTVTFENLPLGYYFVESSLGTICSLDTMNPEVTIKEKNEVPTVEKKVLDERNGNQYKTSNTAQIGDTVTFQTTITAKAGAKNYVLHDKMDEGLSYGPTSNEGVYYGNVTGVKYKDTKEDVPIANYKITSNPGDGCTFHIEFTQAFCDSLKNDRQIEITYTATLNEKAKLASETNKNTTYLVYGDQVKTTESVTETKTYTLPVFKFRKAAASAESGLAGAVFVLSKNEEGTDQIALVLVKTENGKDIYRVAKSGETGIKDNKVTTPDSGYFNIQGLAADTYYLKEVEAPKGYNKLSQAVKIKINDDGTITVDDAANATNQVKVENKSGSLLPATGDIGTRIFYLLGAVLVLGSGVVLITKKRMK